MGCMQQGLFFFLLFFSILWRDFTIILADEFFCWALPPASTRIYRNMIIEKEPRSAQWLGPDNRFEVPVMGIE